VGHDLGKQQGVTMLENSTRVFHPLVNAHAGRTTNKHPYV
jgi:hypothetical protein